MATSNEYLAIYVLEYQAILDKLRFFTLEHPDNFDGYNILVEVAEDIKLRAQAAGFTELPPLPKRK